MKNNTYSKRRQWGNDPAKEYGMAESHEISTADLRSIMFYRDLHRYISRYWKCHMSPAEFAVVDMIFDRTIGWGKLWEWVSLNQFVFGVWNEKKVYSDGTGMSKRTVQRAIDALVERNIILKRGKWSNASKFALNLLWKPPVQEYRNGITPFRPLGSESYWEKVADGNSRETYVIIQREGDEFYESHFTNPYEEE